MNSLHPPGHDSFLALPRSGDLPEVWIAATGEGVSDPRYKTLRAHIHAETDGQRVSSNPFALAYLAVLRVERIHLVRYPKRALVLRTCSELRKVLYWAIWLSCGKDSISKFASVKKGDRV